MRVKEQGKEVWKKERARERTNERMHKPTKKRANEVGGRRKEGGRKCKRMND